MIHKQSYKAYAAATQTVAKTKQVIILYDAAIKSAKKALEAISQTDIQTRYNELQKASDIVFGLQGSLDFEAGGEIAQTLYDYYASIDARILSIHRSNDTAMLEGVIRDLKAMRDAWVDIDKMDEEGELHPDNPPSNAKPAPKEPPKSDGSADGGVAISA